MSASLVGSEMCIRDRSAVGLVAHANRKRRLQLPPPHLPLWPVSTLALPCLLYTSDAADDM
eukprot:14927574-Alexandrium_andersonii.AAC.1